MTETKKEVTVINKKGNWWFKVQIPSGWKLMDGLKKAIKEINKKNKGKSISLFGLGGGWRNVQAYLSQCQKLHGSNPNTITLPDPGGPGIYEANTTVVNVTTLKSNEPFIHCHASLTGGEKLDKPTGGHIVDADVELTTEFDAFVSDAEILRDTDDATGLPLKLTSRGAGRFSDGEIVIFVSFVTIAVWLSVITFFLVKMLKKSK